jgi:hypothetical protein
MSWPTVTALLERKRSCLLAAGAGTLLPETGLSHHLPPALAQLDDDLDAGIRWTITGPDSALTGPEMHEDPRRSLLLTLALERLRQLEELLDILSRNLPPPPLPPEKVLERLLDLHWELRCHYQNPDPLWPQFGLGSG